jgi:hypothetical protein
LLLKTRQIASDVKDEESALEDDQKEQKSFTARKVEAWISSSSLRQLYINVVQKFPESELKGDRSSPTSENFNIILDILLKEKILTEKAEFKLSYNPHPQQGFIISIAINDISSLQDFIGHFINFYPEGHREKISDLDAITQSANFLEYYRKEVSPDSSLFKLGSLGFLKGPDTDSQTQTLSTPGYSNG